MYSAAHWLSSNTSVPEYASGARIFILKSSVLDPNPSCRNISPDILEKRPFLSNSCAFPVECLPNRIPSCGPPSEDFSGRSLLLLGQSQIKEKTI